VSTVDSRAPGALDSTVTGVDPTGSTSRALTVLNHGTLRGVGAGLSMPSTLVESISPQTVNSRRELEAFQPLPRDFLFPGIFSTNASPAPLCVRNSAGRVRNGLPVDQGRRR
jgi:hypothetical protein